MLSIDNSQIKILLVDDTVLNLEIAGKSLEREGYDLYLADNGYTALEIVKEIALDLILLDIMMPELDGFETCKKIKEIEAYKDIPVIFLTAKADIESIVEGFSLGAVDYIRKPFNSMELTARVKTHIELKRIREELEVKNKELQEAYEKLKTIAKTDPLTGLINRRGFIERMEYEQNKYERNKKTFALIIADIDFFKRVNDTYGHECGDKVLVGLADIFKNNTRKQDSIGRWGGEEFVFMLPDTNKEQGAIFAEKFRKRVEDADFSCKGNKIDITITMGVSDYKEGQSLDALISEADKALYEGKSSGRNCVVIR